MGVLCYLLIFWMLMYIYREHLSSKPKKLRRKLKLLRNHLQDRINYDRDVLEEEKLSTLTDYHGQADEMLKEEKIDAEKTEKFLQIAEKKYARIYPKRKDSSFKEVTELLVVVFGVVMGLRALFFQPFKIPTGSMQPSLFGIHFEGREEVPGSTIKRFFDYLNFGATYVDVKVASGGSWGGGTDNSLRLGPVTLLAKTRIQIGSDFYDVGVDPKTLRERVLPNANLKPEYAPGDVFVRGAVYEGDYIMVDRLSYRFREPRRGDIVVFITEGLHYPNGSGLSGRHYIKRMVGLPGDTLMIKDRKLHVKEAGASDFVVVDAKYAKAFDRMYSGKGGYHGYTTGWRLGCEGDTITLGKDEYFAMGDNSRNSADSRAWGILPRKNIIGRAVLIWWPFSRRWGFCDHAEPVDKPTRADWFEPNRKRVTPSLHLQGDDAEDTPQ